MAGRIPQAFIDDLLVRVDIVDLIDKQVPLKKSGSNFVARCPFHNEKTPSFSVSRGKQFYHCFGCGASGNAISFLIDYGHLDFVEAVEELASSAGLDVPREAATAHSGATHKADFSRLFELLQQSARCYAEQLRTSEGDQAVAYLKARGLSGQVARDYQLGYAPDQWQFISHKFDRKQLLDVGLLVSKEDGNVYDRFRGRIIFPIRDRRGRVLGFGGRVMDNSLPKYLNSPETTVFHKGQEVYGLYELLESDAKPKTILITEGYMDVIVLAQADIKFAVACLGTAISKAHIDLLFRFTKHLVFCFDGDQAGRQAAWRAVEAALPSLKEGRQVHVMLLAQGMDPDSLVREIGKAEFLQRMTLATSLSNYFFEYLATDLSLSDMEGRASLVEKAKPYLGKLPDGAFREMMYAELTRLAKAEVLDVFDNQATLNGAERRPSMRREGEISLIRRVIILLLQNPELITVVEKKKINWSGLDMPGFPLFKQIIVRIMHNPQVNLAGLAEGFRGTKEEKQIKALAKERLLIPDGGLLSEFSGALDRLLEQTQYKLWTDLNNKQQREGLSKQELTILLRLTAQKGKKNTE